MATATTHADVGGGEWVQWAIMLVSAAAIGGYVMWPSVTGEGQLDCVGAHSVNSVFFVDETTLALMPGIGAKPVKVTTGPKCQGFKPVGTALADSGLPRLCVGDDLVKLGAKNDECKVQEILQIRPAALQKMTTVSR